MPSQASLIALAVALAFAFGGGWKLRDYQAQGDALEAAKASLATVQKALIDRDALSVSDAMKSRTLEETLAAMRETKTEVQIVREKEYVAKPVYTQCVVPADGVSLLNGRIAARHSAADPGKR